MSLPSISSLLPFPISECVIQWAFRVENAYNWANRFSGNVIRRYDPVAQSRLHNSQRLEDSHILQMYDWVCRLKQAEKELLRRSAALHTLAPVPTVRRPKLLSPAAVCYNHYTEYFKPLCTDYQLLKLRLLCLFATHEESRCIYF